MTDNEIAQALHYCGAAGESANAGSCITHGRSLTMENVATEEFISRTEALEDFEACNAGNPNWTPQRTKTLLLRQPAADVAPVVRCRDCENCRELNRKDPYENDYVSGVLWCMSHRRGIWPDDFCSMGERKMQ